MEPHSFAKFRYLTDYYRLQHLSSLGPSPLSKDDDDKGVRILASEPSCPRFDSHGSRFFQSKKISTLLRLIKTLVRGKWTVAWKCWPKPSITGYWQASTTKNYNDYGFVSNLFSPDRSQLRWSPASGSAFPTSGASKNLPQGSGRCCRKMKLAGTEIA